MADADIEARFDTLQKFTTAAKALHARMHDVRAVLTKLDETEKLRAEQEEMRRWAYHLRAALTVARMAIEQGKPITGRVAANGPTIGQVIDGALALEPKP